MTKPLPKTIASSANPVAVCPKRRIPHLRAASPAYDEAIAAPTAMAAPARRRPRGASAAPAYAAVMPRTARPTGTVLSGAVFILSPAISAAAKTTVPVVITGLSMRCWSGRLGAISPLRVAAAMTANGVMPRWPATRPMRKERSIGHSPKEAYSRDTSEKGGDTDCCLDWYPTANEQRLQPVPDPVGPVLPKDPLPAIQRPLRASQLRPFIHVNCPSPEEPRRPFRNDVKWDISAVHRLRFERQVLPKADIRHLPDRHRRTTEIWPVADRRVSHADQPIAAILSAPIGATLPKAAGPKATHFRPFGRSTENPETGRSTNSQQSRFSIFNGPFRENAIANRFWENAHPGGNGKPILPWLSCRTFPIRVPAWPQPPEL